MIRHFSLSMLLIFLVCVTYFMLFCSAGTDANQGAPMEPAASATSPAVPSPAPTLPLPSIEPVPTPTEVPISCKPFTGEVQQGDAKIPFNLILSPTEPSGDFDGTVEWPTLGTVTEIRGKRIGDAICFQEVRYIKKGNAPLNRVYSLQPSAEAGIFTGTWREGTEKGMEPKGTVRVDFRQK